jgi:hypothetical protein
MSVVGYNTHRYAILVAIAPVPQADGSVPLSLLSARSLHTHSHITIVETNYLMYSKAFARSELLHAHSNIACTREYHTAKWAGGQLSHDMPTTSVAAMPQL